MDVARFLIQTSIQLECRLFYNGKVVSVEPPSFVELLVTECPPNVKGNTASGGE